jgi:hypothetical protein
VAQRLQSITNNHGYQLKVSYASNTLNDLFPSSIYDEWSRVTSVRAINNAVDYCDPAANTCSFSITWPEAVFGLTAISGGVEYTVTTPVGETTRYTSNNGYQVTGIRRPGASSDNVTVSYSGLEVQSVSDAGCRGDVTRETRTIVNGMLANPATVRAIAEAWAFSDSVEHGRTHTPHGRYNEHGFFVSDTDYSPGTMIHGIGYSINLGQLPVPAGYSIFYHTHPYPASYGGRTYYPYLSLADRRWADSRGAAIIAQSEQEERGRQWWIYDGR